MSSMREALLLALPASIAAGMLMGNTTVNAMQYRTEPVAVEADRQGLAERAYERGLKWAQDHGVPSADSCPEPDADFLRGCVAASSG